MRVQQRIFYTKRGWLLIQFLKCIQPPVRDFLVAGFLIVVQSAGYKYMPGSGLAYNGYLEPPAFSFKAFIKDYIMIHFAEANDEFFKCFRSGKGMLFFAL